MNDIASTYPDHEAARFGRENGTVTRSPELAIERLRRALAHDWTDAAVSTEERDLYEQAFAEQFVASVMAMDVRVGDEVMPVDLDQVNPAPTNIDAHYVLVGIEGDSALIRRASFPTRPAARTPMANLRRVSQGACSVHADLPLCGFEMAVGDDVEFCVEPAGHVERDPGSNHRHDPFAGLGDDAHSCGNCLGVDPDTCLYNGEKES